MKICKYCNGACREEGPEFHHNCRNARILERKKIIELLIMLKPLDDRCCSDPGCCPQDDPDYKVAWDEAIEYLKNIEEN